MTNDTSKLNNSSTNNKARPWIQTGRFEFETVCRSTLCPKEWLQVEKIHVCECCLKTTIYETSARRHRVCYYYFIRFNDFNLIIIRQNARKHIHLVVLFTVKMM